MKNTIRLSVLIFLIFSFCRVTFAQFTSGFQISGTVKDERNNKLEYVSITIVNLGINTTTDKNGNYYFFNIPEGTYLLSFKLTGYESKTLEITVSGKHNTCDITLKESLIMIPVIDVTSSTKASDVSNSVYSITSVNIRELFKKKSENLSESLQNLPGVNNISTGSSIGKPVIRGLYSNSIIVIHDGVKNESQQWGDEHGPELSLFDIDRIEILRGPSSLLYGADGIGGVVNVVSKPLEFSSKKKMMVYGELLAGSYTVNKQFFSNLMIGLGLRNLGFKGHFGYRKSGNTKTPDGIFIAKNPDGTNDTIQGGLLTNSGNTEFAGGITFGLNGNHWKLNFGFETLQRELQMHDPDPLSTGNQRLNTNHFLLDGILKLSDKFTVEPQLSYQMQIRKEFESIEDKNTNNASLNLNLKTFNTKLNLHNSLSKQFSGTVGISFNYQKNTTTGNEKLIPNYDAYSAGIFVTETYQSKKLKLSLGGRFDTKSLNIKHTIFEEPDSTNGFQVKEVNDRKLNFNAVTGSFGILYKPASSVFIYSNIGRGWRAPTEFELFVDGEHEGTNRYDRGLVVVNSSYKPSPEESFNIDAGLRLHFSSFNADISIFRNQINNYIFPTPTGDTINELPVYNINQDKSTFWGYEYSIQFEPLKWLLLAAQGDYTFTKNEATGNPLPFTPAMKNILTLRMQKRSLGKLFNPYLSISAKIVSPQNRVDPLESKTDGYTLFSISMGFEFEFAKSITSIDLSADNIFDTKYVDHLSRYKSYALNPGRSFNLSLNIPFKL